MQALARGLGAALQRVLGTSAIETFSAVITIFIGQSEIAVALRPFLALLTGAELFAVMTSGAASTAGSILAGYAGLGVPMPYLLAASFMAIPGGLLYAKILVPSTEPSRVKTMRVTFAETRAVNVIEAAADGTQKGLAVAVAVGAMLIAFVGLIALVNGVVAYWGRPRRDAGRLDRGAARDGFGAARLAPGRAVGPGDPGRRRHRPEARLQRVPRLCQPLAGPEERRARPRTTAILCFALCGFANLSSIAIQLASFGSLVPERRAEVASYGLRAILAGTLSNLTSAAIAGVFIGA